MPVSPLALAAAGIAIAALLLLGPMLSLVRGWARGLLQSRERTLEQEFSEAFVFIESRAFAWVTLAMVLVVAVLVTLLGGSGLLGCAAGLATLVMPAVLARAWRKRRRARLLAQLPDALDLMAASLRSGLSLVPAIEHLAVHQPRPLGQEFSLVVRRQRLGRPLEEALEALRERIGGREVALFTAAVAVARELGGNLSEVLARLAATLREQQAIERKIVALTAQGKLQARIVGALPLVLLLVMNRMEPRPMHLLYTTAQGWAALAMLALLEVSGLWLLNRQARIDV
jgi:tight adherence protein B